MENEVLFNPQLPPGIRFRPSDEELIKFYLHKKVQSLPLPANVIADIELYKYNPWDLPKKAFFGDDEWYFFTPRDRKYPNGGRPNRAAGSGYWKATGTDKPILSSSGSKSIGVKKHLIFYRGRPQKCIKTDWIMTEYRLPDTAGPSRSKRSMRLDNWVLCRIRQKGNMSNKVSKVDQSPKGLAEYLPLVEEEKLPSVETEFVGDFFSDHFLSDDCHLTAPLLVGLEEEIDSVPKTTYQSSNNKETTYANKSEEGMQATDRPFQGLFNLSSRQHNKEGVYVSFEQFDKMITFENINGGTQSGNLQVTNCGSQHNLLAGNIEPNPVFMNLQEFKIPYYQKNLGCKDVNFQIMPSLLKSG